MEQNWWSADWIKYFIGWAIGIPSGLVANWLYDKIKVWRRKETEFLNTSYSKGVMKFEGQYTANVPIEKIIKQILKPLPEQPLIQEPSSQDNQPEASQ